MSTASAPIEIGRVALTVNDLPEVSPFYQHVLGLHRLSGDGAAVLLGPRATACCWNCAPTLRPAGMSRARRAFSTQPSFFPPAPRWRAG